MGLNRMAEALASRLKMARLCPVPKIPSALGLNGVPCEVERRGYVPAGNRRPPIFMLKALQSGSAWQYRPAASGDICSTHSCTSGLQMPAWQGSLLRIRSSTAGHGAWAAAEDEQAH